MSHPTLRRDAEVDVPGLVGARWWQDSVVDPVGRRQALVAILAAGTGLSALGVVLEAVAPTRKSRRKSIDLQREFGWSFGAATENLVYDGQSTQPFDRERLGQLAKELAPRVARHRPFYVETLFEAPTALPKTVSPDDPAPIASLETALQPILTDSMKDAFARAQASAEWLATTGTALVVDLDGPSSVAFAAAASQLFDPVFLFDNWPHPRGVVPAHLALAAAAYYQPMFAKAVWGGNPIAPPMFVLDRQRLAPYTDDESQFDNRWVARMPGLAALKTLGISRLAYVTPTASAPWEADDLNDDFVADHGGGISIVAFPLTTLSKTLASVGPESAALARVSGTDYAPLPRRTPFSSGVPSGSRPTPSDFGSVEVLLSLFGGTMLGVAWSRSGTWNRSGGWGGG
jgi:hypothetical protein